MSCENPPLKITALLIDDMSISSTSGSIEILCMAAKLAGKPLPIVRYVSLKKSCVTVLGGLTIQNASLWSNVDDSDIVLIGSCGNPDFNSYRLPQDVEQWLKDQVKKSQLTLSFCSGTFLLAEMGLLNARSTTIHWMYAESFRNRFPRTRLMMDTNVTHDDSFICASGVLDYFESTMILVDELFGPTNRIKCEELMGLNRSNVKQMILHSFTRYRQHNDALIHKLQDWMHDIDPKELSVTACAERCYLSERHMKRRFKSATGETPMQYIQRIKVAISREQLETTNFRVDQISQQLGYSDTNHFRSLFKKFFGIAPTEYRKKYALIN